MITKNSEHSQIWSRTIRSNYTDETIIPVNS